MRNKKEIQRVVNILIERVRYEIRGTDTELAIITVVNTLYWVLDNDGEYENNEIKAIVLDKCQQFDMLISNLEEALNNVK